MAIEKSILNENDILELLKKQYGIDSNIRITKLPRGSSNIFKIESENGNYILKEFNSDRKAEDVEKELRIINFLKSRNILVPTYQMRKDREYICDFKGKIITLQQYIDGYTIENNTGDYNKTMQSARTLGKIVKELKTYGELDDANIMEKNFSRKALKKSIEIIEKEYMEIKPNNKFKDRCMKDLQDKIIIGNKLLKDFNFEVLKDISILGSHGDYNVQQLIYNYNNEVTVIDFETAKKMPIVWEIMRSYSYIDEKAKDGKLDMKNLIDYFREFSKYVKLKEHDLKYAPHIYLLQLIGSPFGYREYNRDEKQEELLKFGLFRTNLCRYLYKNADEIGNQLVAQLKNKEIDLEI